MEDSSEAIPEPCHPGCCIPSVDEPLIRGRPPIKFMDLPDEEAGSPRRSPNQMKDRDNTGTADQRRTNRRALEARVDMRIETSALTGQSDNISRAGLLFYSEQPIRVAVEVAEENGSRTYHGRLIRLQRISDSSTGLAIEFDAE